MHHIRFDTLRRGLWTPNDTKHLIAGATNHDPVPMNGYINNPKFGRNRMNNKVGMPRSRTNIFRNCRLSASAAFRTVENQSKSSLVEHSRSMGW